MNAAISFEPRLKSRLAYRHFSESRNSHCPQPIGYAGQKPEGMERAMGIEPTWLAWKARALPLSYARVRLAFFDKRHQ